MHLGAPARLAMGWLALLAVLGPFQFPAAAGVPPSAEGTITALSGVSRVSEQAIRKTQGSGGSVKLQVRLHGADVELDLAPHSLRAPECEAFAEGAGGVRTRIELPPVATYRGVARGGARGVVAASVVGEEVRARILLEDGTDWYIEPLPGGAGAHAVYRGADVTETPGVCGMEDGSATVRTGPTPDLAALPGIEDDQETRPAPAPQGIDAVSSGCVEAEIAFEADYAYFVRNGSSTAQTVADIEAVMNSVELIYSRDARIGYKITHYLIQTTDGKYPGSSAAEKLVQFRDWWNANHGSVPRDMAHLMTGVSLDDYIGYASIAVVCDRASAYGLSRSTSAVYSNRVGLTAHELGHNWGAGHCNSLEDCRIMCSVINGCDQDPTRMSVGSILEIEAYRSFSASCLAAGTGTPTPLNPTARDDRAVAVRSGSAVIPVLANDFDANCQSISVGAYFSPTATGGTVFLSGDALTYRPAPGFVGKDTFTYAARDGAGGQSTATVTVDVQDWKVAEDASGTLPGLQIRYYHVPPLDQDLASMPALANPFRIEIQPSLSFPLTSGAFGESGLADRVGARCTGTLTIPETDTYTFYLTSDDGAKLYVDGLLRIDHDGIHTASERSAALRLERGGHTVRVDYYDDTGPSVLRLEWRRGSGARGVIPAMAWEEGGVQVAYYHLDSSRLPPLAALVPEKIATVSSLDVPFTWGAFAGSGRSQHVGAMYEGLIVVPADDVYSFELTSEDGSRLMIGDRVVVDNDGVHNRTSATGGIALRAGAHRARIEYFLREQGCALTLQVWTATMTKRVVPSSWWRRVPTYHVPTGYPTLSAAIAAAPNGATVWVAPGWYTGAGNRNLDLDGKAIRVVAGGGPALTILDAQGLGRVFHLVNHTQPSASIEGFTLTGGRATSAGGGVFLENSSLRVRGCRIQGNSSGWNGGAVAVRGASNPHFEDCVITGNEAKGAGGAIHAEAGARPFFVGCTVAGNRAGTSGGGAHVVESGTVTFDRSILWGNSAGTEGPEAWTGDAGSTVQLSCSSIPAGGAGGSGTEFFGVGNLFANPRFCTPVAASRAPTTGGGYRVASSSPVLSSSCGARVGALEQGCATIVTGIEDGSPAAEAPRIVTLRQNVPNPFNPSTRISFSVPHATKVSLRVFDVAGRLVATLVDGALPAGEHGVTWRGENERGEPVSSGVYFYRLRAADAVETRSMVLLQ